MAAEEAARNGSKSWSADRGKWDEREHGLDYLAPIHTSDFRVTGTGHRRIEQIYLDGCREVGRRIVGYSETQPEQRIARSLCQNAQAS